MASRAGPLADATSLPAAYQAASPALHQPALQGARRADVVIVGGGYTGLSAALHLAQAGCEAVVLEAREVGWGGSGRAFGQVVPFLKHDESHVFATFGPDWGERLITAAASGPAMVAHLIGEHGIACEQGTAGLLFASHATKTEAALQWRARFWQDRGADVTILHDDALAAETGTSFYRSALLDRRGFCLNPLAYARGLARAVLRVGGAIYERSPAISIRQVSSGWRLQTPDGDVTAEQAIIATDAYTGDLWPGLRRSIIPLRAYQLVSQPLSDNVRRSVLPGGQALTDTRRLYSGIRMRSDGRLQLSVTGPALDNRGKPDRKAGTRRVRALFPNLPPLTWDSAVIGWVGMSADQYPHLHQLAPGLTAAIGLSGRGIALGTLLGREASLRVLGRPLVGRVLPDTPLRPTPPALLARPVLYALLAGYRALDALELRRAGQPMKRPATGDASAHLASGGTASPPQSRIRNGRAD